MYDAVVGAAMRSICPICQHTEFGPVPNGRLSRRGMPPRCLKCRSLERHRSGRALMEALRDRERFKRYALLQFADEGIVARGWFQTAEVSPTSGVGALNPQAIARSDGTFDVVVSSHIITRVADHLAAVREIGRVLNADGLAFLSYPAPSTRETTSDWGIADPARNGNYRLLGRDFEPQLRTLTGDAYVIAVKTPDPVTRDEDLIYLITRNFFWVRRMLALSYDARLVD